VSETAILSRLISPEEDNLRPEAAEDLLLMRFAKPDLDRMHELMVINQEGLLCDRDMDELESYRRVGFMLDLLHSKTRRSLKKHRALR
jgi:hypothetical protein